MDISYKEEYKEYKIMIFLTSCKIENTEKNNKYLIITKMGLSEPITVG